MALNGMTSGKLNEKDLEGSSHSLIKILVWHFLDGMRKTTKEPIRTDSALAEI
jgi:hypothetical protein